MVSGSTQLFFRRRERTHARADPVVPGSWLGGVSVRVRRASEARECVMSTEYERCLNNESREQSQSHPGLGGGDPRGGMSVVPTRGSQVECLATCSECEDKTIDEAYTSSVDALTGGLTPRLGRCEQEDTEGWKDARVSGRGGETPLETRRKVRRGDGGVACEAGEDGVHAVGAREVNSIPAGVHKDTEPELLWEPHEMRKTSATEGRLRNPPEPRYDGATYDLRVRDAVHIVPPDVADVVSVANAGCVQGRGVASSVEYKDVYMSTVERENTFDTQDDAAPTSPARATTSTCRPRDGGEGLRQCQPQRRAVGHKICQDVGALS